MLTSRDGRLHVDLVAAPATYTIDGHQFQGMLYNGEGVTTPVCRVRPGDILTVTLHNQLPEETSLHFHGIDVSPLKNGDNVFVHVAPMKRSRTKSKSPKSILGFSGFIPICTEKIGRSSANYPVELLLKGVTGSILS